MKRKTKALQVNGLKVRILPSGAFNIQIEDGVTPNGKRKMHSITDKDWDAFQHKVYEWLAERDTPKTDTTADAMTLDDALKRYIDTCRMGDYSPATIVDYDKMRRNSFGRIINKRLCDLTYDDIQETVKDRARVSAPKTVHNDFGLLHKVLKSYRPSLDLSQIVLPSKKKSRRVSMVETDCDIPTEEQVVRLLKAAKSNRELFLSILLCSDLGLRRSEVAALEWKDVDFERQCVSINKAVVISEDRTFVLKGTKSAEGERELPMSDELAAILKRYAKKTGLVIGITPNAITRRWERLKHRLNIKGRFHDLRHYHCSVMVSLNVPKEYIMRDMGHSTDGLYQRVYTHMMPEAKKEIYHAMAEHSSKTITEALCDE